MQVRRGGPPHQPALYIGRGGTLRIPGPTVTTVRERIGYRAIATNQTMTRRPSNGPTRATQGGKRGKPLLLDVGAALEAHGPLVLDRTL